MSASAATFSASASSSPGMHPVAAINASLRAGRGVAWGQGANKRGPAIDTWLPLGGQAAQN